MVTIHKIQSGRGHYYQVSGDPTVEGKRLTSVTAITGKLSYGSLVDWGVKTVTDTIPEVLERYMGDVVSDYSARAMAESISQEAKAKREAAASLGTRLHEMIHESITNPYESSDQPPLELDIELQELQRYFASYKAWATSRQLVVTHSEEPVYNPLALYAGTIDIVGELDGKRVIIDIKTAGRGARDDMAMQLAAYQRAWKYTKGEDISQALIVVVHADSVAEYPVDLAAAYDLFLMLATIHRRLLAGGTKLFTKGQVRAW